MLDRLVFINESIKQKLSLAENEALEILILTYPLTRASADTTNGFQQSQTPEISIDLDISLDGEGSSVLIRQASLVAGETELSTRVSIEHNAKKCRSNLLSKCVLSDRTSKSSWQGNVLINPGAKDTITYEENRNLLLTQGAKAQSEPNLEIFEGDIISAGHASATGRFEYEQLFYLMSRGIDERTAKSLVVRGFLLGALADVSITEAELEHFEQGIEAVLEEK
ncbi:MAG: SufD family Fe-S cluster assembly protein [Candidatus Ancillula sp.]|nr:SufD family Fe-S cluster assembly protein [Candidatus Ancillula sp.]